MKESLESYFDRLWPINRSLTGNGNRETLQILSELIPLTVHETPSGTACFDWVVPPEWNVREAWIKDDMGKIVVDFSNNNLHLLGYSIPFRGIMPFEELKSHLYSKPSMPEVIPYLTSYYAPRWGFCLSDKQLQRLDPNAQYEVFIDSDLNERGSLTWAEYVIPGKSDQELFFSTYICHPSMGSDVLSGMLANAFLAKKLSETGDNYYTYRFLFIPETIGSINYLAQHGKDLREKMHAGYVLTCLGDAGPFTFKRSRNGHRRADRIAERVLRQSGAAFQVEDFWPGGSDERQYCSPAFDLPVGSLMRTRYEVFPEYHTSADDKSLMDFDALYKGIQMYLAIVDEFENYPVLVGTNPNCEPLLGKRGLYPTLGAQEKYPEYIDGMMWILNLADGQHDILDVADRSGLRLEMLQEIEFKLRKAALLK